MSELLLVPIHVDALCVGDRGLKLISPLADFTKIPYACWVTETRHIHGRRVKSTSSFMVHTDFPFTSQKIMRPPAALAETVSNYVGQTTGIHLHWSLPDALTVMRADPDSNNQLRFPQVPNRWLITSKTKSNGDWQVEAQWVVESDYLYPEEATEGGLAERPAITFPIVPLERYRKVLTNPPPAKPKQPSDITDPDYDAVYSAPFRYMGRAQPISDWKMNDSGSSQYLHQLMPDGLTAVGYGDPLFAAVYTNCSSVFGFVHRGAQNTEPRRYDILGWYDSTQDCLKLFASLARQKPDTKLYEALCSEYKWKVTRPPATFPTLSLYHASVDVEPHLKPNPALAGARLNPNGPPNYTELSVAVGNTGTEALSADVANTLAKGAQTNRIIMEDQLEAIGLRHELSDTNVDLAARFRQARQQKGFQPRRGGTLWSIQLRNINKDAARSGSPPPSQLPAIPTNLAQLLNDLNLAQAKYDAAWQEIETMRHRVYADWYKFESAYNYSVTNMTVIYTNEKDVPGNHSNPTQEPTWGNVKAGNIKLGNLSDFVGDDDEILSYIQEGSLQELKQRVAQTGLIEIGKDAAGKVNLTATSANHNPYVANQYTFAQGVLLRLRQLRGQLDEYNAAPMMQQAQYEFSILRKSAPRFWQPNEPAVLLKGPAVPSTLRHGQDGRASEDDTLTCQVLSVSTALDDDGISSQLRGGDPHKVIQTIQSTIESLRPQTVTPTTIGFSQQTDEPWHPISLEWEVSVWPEILGMKSKLNQALAGKDYKPRFIGANYEFDVNACDLSLMHPPCHFTVGESENVYAGRTTLTPSAGRQLRFNIAQYLMGLTLFDLKTAIVGDNELSDELDYQVDQSLLAWAKTHFTLTDIPTLKDPATITGPDKQEQITEQQNAVAAWYRTQHIFRVAVTTTGPNGQPLTTYQLVDFDDTQHFPANWYDGKPVLTGTPPSLTLKTFGALSPAEKVHDPLNTSLLAHSLLNSPDLHVQAQSLGGLNNALLMRQQMPQVPVFDLNAMIVSIQGKVSLRSSPDEKYKNLTRDVAAAVAGGNNSSPVTTTEFLPIRSGVMKINKLYLVDTFGQVLDVSPASILPSDTLTISRNVTSSVTITPAQDTSYVYLAPRVTQPARLNFRWLAADRGMLNSPDEPEMNDHPATSPVCGWLIPNHLDDSLMFYDAQGVALGSILQTAAWEPAPGTVNRVRLSAIPNPHLRQLATYLSTFSKQNSGFWPDFLTSLNYALENIEPASYAQHEALALLIGRPIAVVRASLSLQLQGKPALNQRWEALLSDMYDGFFDGRVSNKFTEVKFPVRLGEYKQFNDGLVGYWIEDGDGYQDDKFYSSQAEDVKIPHILTHNGKAITQNLTLTPTPLKLTMLVDPRGEVHATSGVLPTKRISIPPDQYAGILKKLAVTFMTAPVLTDHDGIRLNLPQESGYSWSWLARPSPSVWRETERIQAADNTLRFTPQRLVGGWLKLTPENKKS
jgi:hypothetical protein